MGTLFIKPTGTAKGGTWDPLTAHTGRLESLGSQTRMRVRAVCPGWPLGKHEADAGDTAVTQQPCSEGGEVLRMLGGPLLLARGCQAQDKAWLRWSPSEVPSQPCGVTRILVHPGATSSSFPRCSGPWKCCSSWVLTARDERRLGASWGARSIDHR